MNCKTANAHCQWQNKLRLSSQIVSSSSSMLDTKVLEQPTCLHRQAAVISARQVRSAQCCAACLNGGHGRWTSSWYNACMPWTADVQGRSLIQCSALTTLMLCGLVSLQLGESLEEQLGQRLLRMPPPPQLPPRVRPGQQHLIEQQQQPVMFQLPQELPPVLADPMQVRHLHPCLATVHSRGGGMKNSFTS